MEEKTQIPQSPAWCFNLCALAGEQSWFSAEMLSGFRKMPLDQLTAEGCWGDAPGVGLAQEVAALSVCLAETTARVQGMQGDCGGSPFYLKT